MGDLLKGISYKIKGIVDVITSNEKGEDESKKTKICTKCKHEMNIDDKYCPSCGNSTEDGVRKKEYAGGVVLCPHCNASITHTDAVCPECKRRITGRRAVSSVQEFSNQLMELEKHRKKNWLREINDQPDPIDVKKLALIKSYPIPNTIDDILEFVLLAIANIDVSLSKNTFFNRAGASRREETAATVLRSISNAWVSKMQQAYQKAELMFSDEPVFLKIQKVYHAKMKELNMA